MEQQVKSEKKKNLKYVHISSIQNRLFIIEKINSIIKERGSGATIPTEPCPTVTFWIDNTEKRVGFTVNRKNFKWGWVLNNTSKKWQPCSYMKGMGYDDEFNAEDDDFFNKVLLDNCHNNEVVNEILK